MSKIAATQLIRLVDSAVSIILIKNSNRQESKNLHAILPATEIHFLIPTKSNRSMRTIMTRSAQKRLDSEPKPVTRKQISKQVKKAETFVGPRMTTRKMSAESSANQSAQSA